ncbi:hypothetical protein EIP86_000765 [Pleurotus ostreatoroseus]|nr:hypothetical protein EIP86_000765 [Pleurotus ostreatoroseus]
MADVRALLKAKRQEVRINHPLAAYTASGQLRCVACGTIVKQASSWEGHVGSKAHRTSAARLREEEQRRTRAAEAAKVSGKRKADAVADADGEDAEGEEEGDTAQAVTAGTKRMKLSPTHDASPAPHARASPAAGFPADFFSDPSRAPPPPSDDEEDEDVTAAPPGPGTSAPSAPGTAIDEEWAMFEREVLKNAEGADANASTDDKRDTYERATVFAAPELAPEVPEGFPPLQADEEEGVAGVGAAPELSEEERRRQREQDERELIMDRLLEEERAQEEADAKVAMLKNRLDTIRRQREAKKAARAGKA